MDTKTSNDDSTRALTNHLNCPICTNLFFKPTFFECGHTMCLLCHYNIDKNSESKTYELPIFKCPQCRSTSIIPWNKRPLNVTLDQICAKQHPKEYARLAGSSEPDPTSDRPEIPPGLNDKPQTVDLAKIALDSRKVIARKTYATLFPLILKAAHEGKTFVSIREKSILKSIEISLQPLSQMFFKHNNLHKIMCSPEECTLMLCKTSSRWRREVINADHVEDEPENSGSSQDPATPPPPARRRRILMRRPIGAREENASEAFSRLSSMIRLDY